MKEIEALPAHIWSIILAAGASSRFGGIKALAPWQDGTLLSHAIGCTTHLCGEKIMVVTGKHAEPIDAALAQAQSPVQTIFNSTWEDGIGSSIAAGTQAVLRADPAVEIIMIHPVDQPLVTADHLRALAKAAAQSKQCVLTKDQTRYGPPAAIPQKYFSLLKSLSGECGLKTILKPDMFVTVGAPQALLDIDAPQDLAQLRAFG